MHERDRSTGEKHTDNGREYALGREYDAEIGCDSWSSKYMTSLWADTTKHWEDSAEDWRIIGTNPFADRLQRDESTDNSLYIIEFSSRRLDIGQMRGARVPKYTHVILEADRGEDCGIVKGYTTLEEYEEKTRRHGGVQDKLKIKTIYRLATIEDLRVLGDAKIQAEQALEECRYLIKGKAMDMEILDCEYQFDRHKLTYFYRSDAWVDFRDLVKELYRRYKIRIWMCSVDKMGYAMLKELLDAQT